MKKYVIFLVGLIVSLFASTGWAYTPLPAPANGFYVADQSGKMSSSQIQKLNEKIDRVSKTTKNEFGVLLLPDMGGASIEDVANSTYKAWGIGKKGLDNGCLIVVAIKERKSRIETGKGVEGEITDLQANDILKNNLNPHLKKGDYYGAFDDTLNALSSLMESRMKQKAQPAASPPTVVDGSTSTTPAPKTPSCDVGAVGSPDTGVWMAIFVLGIATSGFFFIRRLVSRRRANEERARLLAIQRREERDRLLAAHARQIKEKLDRETVPVEVSAPVYKSPRIVPEAPKPAYKAPPSTYRTPSTFKKATEIATPAIVGSAVAAAALVKAQREAEEVARRRRDQDERDQDESDRRRRNQEESDRRRNEESSRSSSSSSSFDWGSSSSGGSDSGGGFGGGDSGGGGSSSDW